MKTWIKRSLMALLGLAVVAGGVVACGHRAHGDWQGKDATEIKAKAVQRATKYLTLDAAQQAKAAALADALQAQHQAFTGGSAGDPGANPKAQLQQLISGPSFDRNGAQVLLSQKLASVQTQGPQVIGAMADFFDALRPEQQTQLRELMAKGRHGRHGRDRD